MTTKVTISLDDDAKGTVTIKHVTADGTKAYVSDVVLNPGESHDVHLHSNLGVQIVEGLDLRFR